MAPVGGRCPGLSVLLLAAALGCGRVGFDAQGDAARDGGRPPPCPGPLEPPPPETLPPAGERIADGVRVLYPFDDGAGAAIVDRSGSAPQVTLTASQARAGYAWLDPGLQIAEPTLFASGETASALSDVLVAAGELTVEAWVAPGSDDVGGPGRIVTLSTDTRHRSFTLGQLGARYVFRVRTPFRGDNGEPEVRTAPVARADGTLQHVVATYLPTGGSRVYVDGVEVGRDEDCSGLDAWDPGHRLALGNELTGNRPWLGVLRLVAIYDRALNPDEIAHQLEAGPPSDP